MTASAEVFIAVGSPVRSEASSSIPGLWPTKIAVSTSSCRSRTMVSNSSPDAAYRRSSIRVCGDTLSSAATSSQVLRVRAAGDTTARSMLPMFAASHLPASGAWRRPRSANGRSMSAVSPDQSDFACRSRISVSSLIKMHDRGVVAPMRMWEIRRTVHLDILARQVQGRRRTLGSMAVFGKLMKMRGGHQRRSDGQG